MKTRPNLVNFFYLVGSGLNRPVRGFDLSDLVSSDYRFRRLGHPADDLSGISAFKWYCHDWITFGLNEVGLRVFGLSTSIPKYRP